MFDNHPSPKSNFLWVLSVCILEEIALYLYLFVDAVDFSGLFLVLAVGVGWLLYLTPEYIRDLKHDGESTWDSMKPFVVLITSSLSVGFAAAMINILFFFYDKGLASVPTTQPTPADLPCAIVIAIACGIAAVICLVAYCRYPSDK